MFLGHISGKSYGFFFFGEETLSGVSYLDALQQWIFYQLQDDEPENFIWKYQERWSHFTSTRQRAIG